MFNMARPNVLASIRRNIEDHVGDKVTLKANGGRRKVFVNEGIIEKAYPSIFVIRLDSNIRRKVSYSYSDILTKTVQLVFSA
ncbi:Veg protein [Clostridium tyrobutyricum DIVETGP]|uniref:Veg protein n=2 Tax=Clostridium tyrobutyricum TaxID=1519 RepID=W6NG69_CLOTY|nr:Veg protein [Clostridium tyrobutyricum DIVETGP]